MKKYSSLDGDGLVYGILLDGGLIGDISDPSRITKVWLLSPTFPRPPYVRGAYINPEVNTINFAYYVLF